MPLYAYECRACGAEFERQQSFDDEPVRVCPVCGTEAARRLITPVGIIFKGPGFYITDSRKALGDGRADKVDDAKKPTSKSEKGESATA
jgi:putative FmdB family regulatory protein